MKYKIIVTFLFYTICNICLSQQRLIINGRADVFSDGTKIIISTQTPINSVFQYNNIADTATVINHKFKFNIKANTGELYLLRILNSKKWAKIFLQPAKTSIVLKDTILKDILVTGNKAAEDYIFLEREVNTIKKTDRLKKLLEQYDEISESEPLHASHILDTIKTISDSLDKARAKIAYSWLDKNVNSNINSYIVYTYLRLCEPEEKYEKYLSEFSLKNRQNSYGKELFYYSNNLSIGKELPSLPLSDTAGQKVLFSNFRGKCILVDFWASWCAPCRELKPELVKLKERFKKEDFEIIGVSGDFNKRKWIAAIIKEEYPWIQIAGFDNNVRVGIEYDVQSIPYNIILNKEGKIIAKNVWGEELVSLLDKLIK